MNDPRNEIANVVKSLTLAPTVTRQRSAINKYFIPDASFLHPLCSIQSGPGSRDKIAGIYEWYRDMSPDISLEVESVGAFTTDVRFARDDPRVTVLDEAQSTAYLNVVQTFHIFLSPFRPTPARLLVRVILRRNEQDGKYYIVRQEDYYQPEEVLHLILPFLASPLVYIKRLAGLACGLNAAAFAHARDLTHTGLEFLGLRRRHGQAVISSDHVHED